MIRSSEHVPVIYFTGGGSGGHFFPLVALRETLYEYFPNARTIYVGSTHGLEVRLASRYEWEVFFLPARPFRGRTRWTLPFRLFQVWKTILRARQYLIRQLRMYRDIHVIVSTGGYAGFPLSFAGARKGIPLFLIEPNARPGLANRLLQKYAVGVALSYESSFEWKCETRLTGCPVRKMFFTQQPVTYDGREQFCLLVLGGSQGSVWMNTVIPEALNEVMTQCEHVKVVHQAGPNYVEAVQKRYDHPDRVRVVGFIDDVAKELAQTHLVLSRAGSSTIHEIAALGRPAIFFPLTGLADNHQVENARQYEKAGAAHVFIESRDNPISPKTIADAVVRIILNPKIWYDMHVRMKSMARPHASHHFWKWVYSSIVQNKNGRAEPTPQNR